MFNLYFLDVLKNKYVDFNGRARRSEYWYFALFSTLISWALTYGLGSILPEVGGILSLIYSFAILLPTIGILTRRLHDIGKSGGFAFIILIPIAGIIWLLVLLCTDSDPGENQYGPNPKGIGNTGGDDELINSIGQ
jgi:uncharacterized membrane protein YhaH (DUF805 family)